VCVCVCVWVAEREAVSKQSWLKAVLPVASGLFDSAEETSTTQINRNHKATPKSDSFDHLFYMLHLSLRCNESHVCQ